MESYGVKLRGAGGCGPTFQIMVAWTSPENTSIGSKRSYRDHILSSGNMGSRRSYRNHKAGTRAAKQNFDAEAFALYGASYVKICHIGSSRGPHGFPGLEKMSPDSI